jgi:hypothetical protein
MIEAVRPDAPRRRRPSLAARLLAVPSTVGIVLLGVWVSGGSLTNDFALAMRLTIVWMVLAGVAAAGVAFRSRALRVPVLGSYLVTAAAAGAVLGSSMFFDDVVSERVARPGAGGNATVAAGIFEPVRHAARGHARAVALGTGGRVLTLTGFAVDNGPDLRVYLVAGAAGTEDQVIDVVDLGALKGNRGDQQYRIPDAIDLTRHSTVVIWCRAFSALFARAPLRARA